MKIKIIKIDSGKSGKVFFGVGSVKLSISKRSALLKKSNLKVGDEFELTLKKAKK